MTWHCRKFAQDVDGNMWQEGPLSVVFLKRRNSHCNLNLTYPEPPQNKRIQIVTFQFEIYNLTLCTP